MHPAKEGFAALPFFDEFDLSTVDILLLSQYVNSPPFSVDLYSFRNNRKSLSLLWLGEAVVCIPASYQTRDVACTRSFMCTAELNANSFHHPKLLLSIHVLARICYGFENSS